ncbi:hypothetical protein GCM10027188_09940 [Lysobacter humi (ex Lee et al. 2017)]
MSTFEPQGVSKPRALEFLETEIGEKYLSHLRRADALASNEEILRRAVQQVMSGKDVPTLHIVDEPLIKLVPKGSSVSPYSPFFITQSEMERLASSGQPFNERLALPIASEAPTYDAYAMQAKSRAEVFISEVAPTQELGGLVRRSGQGIQALVPDRGQFRAPELVGTIDNRLAPGQSYRLALPASSISRALDPPSVHGARLRPGTALGVAGAALAAFDAADTGFRIRGHLDRGNATAAESEAIHFGGRTVGGLAGAGLGVAAGAVAGVETGPGMLVTATVGGIAGAVAGDKVAAWIDDRSIYNQTDRQGNEWTLDPERRDLGWRRRAPVDGTQDGIDNARRESLRASPLLESELNLQATRRSAELVLGSPPVPRDPFRQPSGTSDTASVVPAPWVRTADGGWERTVTLAYAERGLAPTRTELATPERAAQLDQAAARTIVQNAENSAPVIAARFEDAYAAQGWARFGPMPDAVRQARTDLDRLVASNGDTYVRRQDGQWVSDGMLMDSTATGNLREELDATRTLLASRLPAPTQQPVAPAISADERLRDTIVGAHRNAGLELSAAQLDSRAAAIAETWRTHGLSADTTALRVSSSGGHVGLDSPIESLRLEPDGRTYRLAATTAVGSAHIDAERSAGQAPALPERASPSGPASNRGTPARAEEDAGAHATRQRLANDPAHGDHATFDRIHTWVRGTGQWDDERSLNVAAALYRAQADDPLVRRVDRVVGGLGRDGAQNAFAVYAPHGDKEPIFHARVDGRIASLQPAQQNLEQAERITQERSQQQSVQQTQEQARAGAVHVR